MEKQFWMYLSLWQEHDGAPGMGLFSLTADTGELKIAAKLDDRHSFGCSCYDARRSVLYVCNEVERIPGVQYETGRIYGYRVDRRDGSLTELFHRDTYCPNPCYISLDAEGEFLVLANYSASGSLARLERGAGGRFAPVMVPRQAPVALYAVNADGSLGELLDVKKHPVDPDSPMKGSFPHCAVFSPSGRLIAVCDKGDGHVYLYTIDREKKELHLLSRTMTDVPGARSRYCVFHPTLPYFVVNHEHMIDGRMMVSSFRYTEAGEVEKICSIHVCPPDCPEPKVGHNEQQGLCISPDGKCVYSALSGPNAIAVLSLDPDSGRLSVLQHMPVSGVWPRGLALAPGGKYLVCSCLVSGDVAVYAVEKDGRLSAPVSAARMKGGAYMSFCGQS